MIKRQPPSAICPPAGIDPAFWHALVDDAGVAFKVCDADGVLLYSNAAYAELIGAASPARLVGRGIHDYLPGGFADEIHNVIRAVALSGKPVMIRTMWRGKPLIGLVRAMRPYRSVGPWVIAVVRAELPSDSRLRAANDFRYVQSVYADEGQIASLSVRERSVLSLIGAGLSTAQIAKNLNRSAKTIENQRHSLGRKLNVSNRVELARIALDCGLTPPTNHHEPRRRAPRRSARP